MPDLSFQIEGTEVVANAASPLLAFKLRLTDANPDQTIHTVVTKPVEKFEIVLGRTFGYVGLATVILLGLSAVSLLLLWASDPSEQAPTHTLLLQCMLAQSAFPAQPLPSAQVLP